MFDALCVLNFTSHRPSLTRENKGEVFILGTCQRYLILGLNLVPLNFLSDEELSQGEIIRGPEAYHYLLKVLCGLESKLVAEQEIINQFKEAMRLYQELPYKNPYILNHLERLMKDSKEVRTKYLTHIGQLSYSGLTKKLLLDSGFENGEVLILGSGQMAQDLAKVLDRRFKLTFCARAQEKLSSFLPEQAQILPWEDRNGLKKFPVIINTIGTSKILFSKTLMKEWYGESSAPKVCVDLGEPSALETDLTDSIYRLKDLFHLGQLLDETKRQKVQLAHEAIMDITHKRSHTFSVSFTNGWDELQFA